MISQGYSDPRTLARRVKKMEAWLEAPDLMEAGNMLPKQKINAIAQSIVFFWMTLKIAKCS